MRNQETLMAEAQARIISNLNEALRTAQRKHDAEVMRLEAKLREYEAYALFYKKMQETILDNPTMMIEWQRFCLLLKMTDPDEEKYEVHFR
jgi:hypothetical protein